MIRNQILERRIAALISQTYAILPVDKVLEEIKRLGIEAVIQQIEENEQNTPKFN